MSNDLQRGEPTPRTVGYGFSTAAGLTIGLQAGALFAINQFYPRSLLALAAAVVSLAIAVGLIVAGWRGRSWISDVALGVGLGGAATTVVVGLVTVGGAG